MVAKQTAYLNSIRNKWQLPEKFVAPSITNLQTRIAKHSSWSSIRERIVYLYLKDHRISKNSCIYLPIGFHKTSGQVNGDRISLRIDKTNRYDWFHDFMMIQSFEDWVPRKLIRPKAPIMKWIFRDRVGTSVYTAFILIPPVLDMANIITAMGVLASSPWPTLGYRAAPSPWYNKNDRFTKCMY